MKRCPHCHKELSKTAVRCRYCRKPLSAVATKLSFAKWIKKVRGINLEKISSPWALREVLLLWFLVFTANFLLDYYGISGQVTEFLRARYFILTKEPTLYVHIYRFISTFILKLSAVVIIWVILKFHKVNFISGLNLNAYIKKEWLWMFPALFMFSAISRLIVDTDPLSPNLPVYLFFAESSLIGNIIIIFSLAVIAPFSEEIFFRGFMYPGINKRLGLYWSILVTSLLFMALHIPQCKEHPIALLIIFLGGIFLTSARAVTKSTFMAILLHCLHNTTVTIVGFIKFTMLKY